MIKELFQFKKPDILMWGGVGAFSLVMIALLSIVATTPGLVFKDLIGLIIVILLPGYVIVKLYLDHVQVSENITKNPDINQAIDKLIMSFGVGVVCIIPLNFLWNYLLTMGLISQSGDIVGNVDEELIYTGSASWRALFTVILVIGVAVGVKIYQLKKKQS